MEAADVGTCVELVRAGLGVGLFPPSLFPGSRSAPADADDLAAHHLARCHGDAIGANHRGRERAGRARQRSLGARAGTGCAHPATRRRRWAPLMMAAKTSANTKPHAQL
jgi:hypothetical protein